MVHVIVVGVGNIGSHIVPHLGRTAGISSVALVDRDRYDPSNRRGQEIEARDVGRPKVAVQAKRLRRVNPDLKITAVHAPVESLPLGSLRANVILACLDSRRARMHVNQSAWRLGVPWINAGVDADGFLARLQVFVPSSDAPCLECAWDQSDYNAVEQDYPCHADAIATTSRTGAPSSLGALAAALQAIECAKLLAGDVDAALVGRDVLLDARHHRHYVTAFRRNPQCRMPDHAGWRIDTLGGSADALTIGDVVAVGGPLRQAEDCLTFSVAGQRLALRVSCTRCGDTRATLRLERGTRGSLRTCRHCGAEVRPSGFDFHDAVTVGSVPAPFLTTPLSRLGVADGDVLTLATPSVEAHYEIGGAS